MLKRLHFLKPSRKICIMSVLLWAELFSINHAQSEVFKIHSGITQTGELSLFHKVVWQRFVRAVELSKLDIKLVMEVVPSERSLMITNTEGDAELMRVKNIKVLAPDITDNLLIIPEALGVTEIVVFAKRTDIIINDWSSLDAYQNGVQSGIKLFEKTPNKYSVTRIEQAFRMLDKDRIDTVVSSRIVGLNIIKNLQLNDIKVLEPTLERHEVFTFLHKKHQALIPKLTEALKTMKINGEFEKIQQQVLSANADLAGQSL
jgi:polar amino acid transport system substrate-binding protein